MKRHVAVIGDLYVDHDVFVTQLESRHDSGAVEPRFEAKRRQDTAGGAANSARILSALSDGHTYLWGIVGSTHWGTFRNVLEASHAIDSVGRPVELRGVADETHPPMNTAMRLLVVDDERPQVVKQVFGRIYDINQVHIPENKRESVLFYLKRIQQKTPLHAIVINDFGRGTLTPPLINEIAQLAIHFGVPLFVDPLFPSNDEDRERYKGIKGTAILPNLSEWCALVSDSHGPEHWRNNIKNRHVLEDMARQSFEHLGNFDYHVIKCDSAGAVLFFPHPDPNKGHKYALYHVEPLPGTEGQPLQIGNGDVMTAVFALEFPSFENPGSMEVLAAFHRANVAVMCYRDMPWHRMPARSDVLAAHKRYPWADRAPDAEISRATLFLPASTSVAMSTIETDIKGLFSQDATFQATVRNILTDIRQGESIVLGAPPGTGKTTIMRTLEEPGAPWGIKAIDMSSTRPEPLDKVPPILFRETFEQLARNATPRHALVMVDEALREPTYTFLLNNAPTLLNAAHAEGVRFLFISAGFKPELEQAPDWREFFRRTKTHYLPGLAKRPLDIPYIIAARVFEQRPAVTRLEVDTQFLLTITDLALVTPEPSFVCGVVDEVLRDHVTGGSQLTLSFEDLPTRYRMASLPKGRVRRYVFYR